MQQRKNSVAEETWKLSIIKVKAFVETYLAYLLKI